VQLRALKALTPAGPALGVLAIALGIGFLISAILSYGISRRLKLIEPAPDA